MHKCAQLKNLESAFADIKKMKKLFVQMHESVYWAILRPLKYWVVSVLETVVCWPATTANAAFGKRKWSCGQNYFILLAPNHFCLPKCNVGSGFNPKPRRLHTSVVFVKKKIIQTNTNKTVYKTIIIQLLYIYTK